MKLIPASRAFAVMRSAAAESVAPPNIIVPRQSGETLIPLRPSFRYCMALLPVFPKERRPVRDRPPTNHLRPERSSVRGPATVHRDGDARRRLRGVAAQEYGQRAEILRRGEL